MTVDYPHRRHVLHRTKDGTTYVVLKYTDGWTAEYQWKPYEGTLLTGQVFQTQQLCETTTDIRAVITGILHREGNTKNLSRPRYRISTCIKEILTMFKLIRGME